MANIRRHVDPASQLVIAITFVLFVVALLVKGLGHDILLEAGVFLVSVKLILMAYKISVSSAELAGRLERMDAAMQRIVAQLEREPLSVAPVTGGDRDHGYS